MRHLERNQQPNTLNQRGSQVIVTGIEGIMLRIRPR
nr:Copper export regulator [Candidatus Pantoea persica]